MQSASHPSAATTKTNQWYPFSSRRLDQPAGASSGRTARSAVREEGGLVEVVASWEGSVGVMSTSRCFFGRELQGARVLAMVSFSRSNASISVERSAGASGKD